MLFSTSFYLILERVENNSFHFKSHKFQSGKNISIATLKNCKIVIHCDIKVSKTEYHQMNKKIKETGKNSIL